MQHKSLNQGSFLLAAALMGGLAASQPALAETVYGGFERQGAVTLPAGAVGAARGGSGVAGDSEARPSVYGAFERAPGGAVLPKVVYAASDDGAASDPSPQAAELRLGNFQQLEGVALPMASLRSWARQLSAPADRVGARGLR